MHRRIAALAVTVATAGAMLLGTASTASATGPGFYLRSHHASLAVSYTHLALPTNS